MVPANIFLHNHKMFLEIGNGQMGHLSVRLLTSHQRSDILDILKKCCSAAATTVLVLFFSSCFPMYFFRILLFPCTWASSVWLALSPAVAILWLCLLTRFAHGLRKIGDTDIACETGYLWKLVCIRKSVLRCPCTLTKPDWINLQMTCALKNV